MKPTEYVLSLGEVHADFLPERSTYPMRPLKKPLKELLLAPTCRNVSTIYEWKDYGMDHSHYYPVLLAGVHSISKNPLGQLEEILSKTSAAAAKLNLKLADGIVLYHASKLQIELPGEDLVASVGRGECDGFGWDGHHFPAAPEEIAGYASKLLNSFAVYLQVRHKELEKSIAGCEHGLCLLKNQS